MEGNLGSGSMMQGNTSHGGFDLQGPMRIRHHQQNPLPPVLHHQHNSHPRQRSMIIHPAIHENFPLTIGITQDQEPTISLADYNTEPDTIKFPNDEDELEDIADSGKGKRASPWHRVKWTDNMVRLLITSVSYISEETSSEYASGSRRKCSNLQKKGKWKSVSKVMAERGHLVSPQQCEDKFNDLNKRYKRLNEILGRGTSCEVVENPVLLDVMDHVSEKSKEEVRKILSSKHLHYEEMCSYHNGNRLHLPADPDLQHSLRLALRNRDDHDENEHEGEYEDHEEYEEHQSCSKRIKKNENRETPMRSLDCNKALNFPSENTEVDVNQLAPMGTKDHMLQKEWITQRNLQLEKQRINIQVRMLELEQERFRWQRFCRKGDRELEMMKMEVERMRLENEHMALELKQREMSIVEKN